MNLCGILNIDKPAGKTSRQIVDQVVRLVRPAKAGHAGTLDPLATGVLTVCVGHATRLIQIVQEGRKLYCGRFRLGLHSDTDDITGNLTTGQEWSGVTRSRLEDLLAGSTGRIRQVPPNFSAIHVAGERAYDLARRGEAIELDARAVEIFGLKLNDFQPPEFELEIECGSGTYVRSLGRDLGVQLGCGAVMTQLRRLAVGPFTIEDAVPADELSPANVRQHLQSASRIVAHFPSRTLSTEEIVAVRRGQTLAQTADSLKPPAAALAANLQSPAEQRTALMNSAGELLGIGVTDATTGRLQPRIVFPATS